MADVELFGLDPVAHHRTSLLLHAASAVALFLWLAGITRAAWKSLFVAGVFALHPLHVESVAWAAERKDVLSTLLGLSSLRAWIGWRLSGRRGSYAAALALFALALLAKPMLVSLPVIFLLLELVPWGATRLRGRARALALLPFGLLAVASCAVTFAAQRRGGAVAGIDALPPLTRIGNAFASCATYLERALLPTRLAIFYPYPDGGVPAGRLALSVALVGGITAFALLRARSRPWIAFGWLWFLATLLPVIGLVQVGRQAMADRYTYLPLIGVSIAVGMEAPRLFGRKAALALGVLAAVGWIAMTRYQVSLWKDDVTLFAHAVRVTDRNSLAHYRLGFALGALGRRDEALAEYRAALAIRPDYADPYNNIGQIEQDFGRPADALASYDRALALDPALAPAHANRANALDDLGRFDEAERSYRAAIRLDPDIPEAHNDFGVALAKHDRLEEAVAELRTAIRLRPRYGNAYLNLARALSQLGRSDEAIETLREGVRLEPDRADARATLEAMERQRPSPPR